jgi:hypothetical protein
VHVARHTICPQTAEFQLQSRENVLVGVVRLCVIGWNAYIKKRFVIIIRCLVGQTGATGSACGAGRRRGSFLGLGVFLAS